MRHRSTSPPTTLLYYEYFCLPQGLAGLLWVRVRYLCQQPMKTVEIRNGQQRPHHIRKETCLWSTHMNEIQANILILKYMNTHLWFWSVPVFTLT